MRAGSITFLPPPGVFDDLEVPLGVGVIIMLTKFLGVVVLKMMSSAAATDLGVGVRKASLLFEQLKVFVYAWQP